MPTKTTKKPKRVMNKPVKKSPTQKSRIVTNNKKRTQTKLQSLVGNRLFLLLAAIVVGGVGTYLLVLSHANPVLPDNPGRGLYYSSFKNGGRTETSGPCAGMYVDDSKGQSASHAQSCIHVDPGPEGINVSERAKTIDSQSKSQVQYDKQHPDDPNVEPGAAGSTVIANDLYAGTLSNVAGNTWPCADTSGVPRVTVMYAYAKGRTNRISSLRDNFTSYIRRTNAVMYNSSIQNGGQPRQVRFTHSSTDCSHLIIQQVEINAGSTASAIRKNMSSMSYIMSSMRAQGWDKPLVKFLVYVDYDGGCGQSEMKADDQPGQANANNTGNTYSLIWQGCWNYAEPHELMHNLGAVQSGAPYGTMPNVVPIGAKATDGVAVPSIYTSYKLSDGTTVYRYSGGHHCVDQHDIMCYDDDDIQFCTYKTVDGKTVCVKHTYEGPTYMRDRCGSTASYSLYDCGDDTYFSTHAPVAGSWLSTHWNAANSQFLARY